MKKISPVYKLWRMQRHEAAIYAIGGLVAAVLFALSFIVRGSPASAAFCLGAGFVVGGAWGIVAPLLDRFWKRWTFAVVAGSLVAGGLAAIAGESFPIGAVAGVVVGSIVAVLAYLKQLVSP